MFEWLRKKPKKDEKRLYTSRSRSDSDDDLGSRLVDAGADFVSSWIPDTSSSYSSSDTSSCSSDAGSSSDGGSCGGGGGD